MQCIRWSSSPSTCRYTLLQRGNTFHAAGKWTEAIADYETVIAKYPADIQAWWLRYSLDLGEVGRRPEALGILRRLSSKSRRTLDTEPLHTTRDAPKHPQHTTQSALNTNHQQGLDVCESTRVEP